ncbi:MAG: hypothetical protein KGY40_07950 [Thioalkalivibrio sp.]|nr:hypothetical protein [Thioalkalivibrio sp.]
MRSYDRPYGRISGWGGPVAVDLAGLTIARQNAPIRLSHGTRVGHADRISIEGGALAATGEISCTGPAAPELVADARNGFPWQASVGTTVERYGQASTETFIKLRALVSSSEPAA